MGDCTVAYPSLRLSHCPSVRISNAASPRLDEIYKNTMQSIMFYHTYSGRSPLPYPLTDLEFARFETERYVW